MVVNRILQIINKFHNSDMKRNSNQKIWKTARLNQV
jgi:hypothetical protein